MGDAFACPFFEDLAEEPTVLLWRDRVFGDSSCFWALLYARDELQILETLLQKVLIQLSGMLDVTPAQEHQDVEVHIVASKPFDSLHNPIVGGGANVVRSVMVMELRRPIQAHTYKKLVPSEKLCPLFVDQDTVGLEAVLDYLVWCAEQGLVFYGLPIEVQPGKCRFTSLPAEGCSIP